MTMMNSKDNNASEIKMAQIYASFSCCLTCIQIEMKVKMILLFFYIKLYIFTINTIGELVFLFIVEKKFLTEICCDAVELSLLPFFGINRTRSWSWVASQLFCVEIVNVHVETWCWGHVNVSELRFTHFFTFYIMFCLSY